MLTPLVAEGRVLKATPFRRGLRLRITSTENPSTSSPEGHPVQKGIETSRAGRLPPCPSSVLKATPFRRGLRHPHEGLEVDRDLVLKATPFRRGLRHDERDHRNLRLRVLRATPFRKGLRHHPVPMVVRAVKLS